MTETTHAPGANPADLSAASLPRTPYLDAADMRREATGYFRAVLGADGALWCYAWGATLAECYASWASLRADALRTVQRGDCR